MQASEEAQEILEKLWVDLIEGKRKWLDAGEIAEKDALKELAKNKGVAFRNKRIKLTKKGKAAAKEIIRRHRLAERLLHDVLEIGGQEMEESACKFEHIISEGVEGSICTLLGHPRVCPHGRSIPRGKCCREDRSAADKIVSALSELRKGDRGNIVYILTKDNTNLRKLISMGVLPGSSLKVIQTFPTYVLQLDYAQMAMDEDIAKDIYVRVDGR